MAAENARQTDKMRTDIHSTRPSSGKRLVKKKKLEATLKRKESGSETEEPSVSEKAPSQGSKSGSNHSTPRLDKITVHIDHHIKYTKNDKLKQWLKEKNKVYRKQVKAEREKKREEREKQILEANRILERKLDSEKKVKKWMKYKTKEISKQKKEEHAKQREEERQRRKMEVNLPGDSLKIRPQSAPPTGRTSDGEQGEVSRDDVEEERLLEDERKQAKAVKEGPHPPQTKFIYKRPVAGKIKFKMQPALQTTIKASGYEPARPGTAQRKLGESHDDMEQRIRMSYDDWLKKKADSDVQKKRQQKAKKDREMAKSDPELNRIVSKQARNRINNLLNSRKRLDTGIEKFDTKLNSSFGGADHDTDTSDKEQKRPRSAYRLEEDKDNKAPALTVKQIKRPQTAPAARGRVPPPKKSANSPRKAAVPKKVDAIMAEEHTTNAFSLPFPPELGIPKHVAEKQRKIFGESEESSGQQTYIPEHQDSSSAAEITHIQREGESTPAAGSAMRIEGKKAEMHDFKEDKKESSPVSNAPQDVPVSSPAAFERSPSPIVEPSEPETLLGNKDENVAQPPASTASSSGCPIIQKEEGDDKKSGDEPKKDESSAGPRRKNRERQIHRQSSATTEFELKEEWDHYFAAPESEMEAHAEDEEFSALKQQKETEESNSHRVGDTVSVDNKEVEKSKDVKFSMEDGVDTKKTSQDETPQEKQKEQTEAGTVTEKSQPDISRSVNVPEGDLEKSTTVKSGILKESKKYEYDSDETDVDLEGESSTKDASAADQTNVDRDDDDDDLPSPRLESLSPSKKRVSFSEQTTVFQAEHRYSKEDFFEVPPYEDCVLPSTLYSDDDDFEPDDSGYEKLSLNIGGLELNPAIIRSVEENMGVSQEATSTFITNPGDTES